MRSWAALLVVVPLLVVVAESPMARATPAAPIDVPACPNGSASPNAAVLIARIDRLLRGRSLVGTLTMSVTTPAWQRTLKFKVWSRGEDLALIRVLEGGPREIGMLTLKRDRQMWNWLPQAGRVMKLPAGMLGDAWMGSDFTNDDLVRGSSWTADFVAALSDAREPGGQELWRVVLTPKPSAVVVWGRIDMLVDARTCQPLAQLFYDEDFALVRRIDLSEIKRVGWREFPSKMTVTPSEPGRSTTLTYDDVAFDADIPDETFSLQRLRQGR